MLQDTWSSATSKLMLVRTWFWWFSPHARVIDGAIDPVDGYQLVDPDARELEELGGLDGPAGNDDLPCGPRWSAFR